MDTVTCPYCGEEVEINHDDGFGYDENETYKMTCDHCDKIFIMHASLIRCYESEQAPCLNGDDHKWNRMHGVPIEFFKNKERCDYCGEERININEDTKVKK